MSVKAMRPKLNQDDIVRLMKGSSAEDRAHATHKLCRRIGNEELQPEDKVFADQILNLLAQDAEKRVRRAMAVTLKNSPNLPREVALKLAHDIDSVALPVIENSPVFRNSDLVELVLNATEAKQIAVAGREKLSAEVADTIAEHACRDAVVKMASNDNANLTERGYGFTIDRFKTDEDVQGALISRSWIPPQVAEKMVSLVSGQMFDLLVNNHELPPQLAIELASGAHERATLDLVEQAGHSSNLPRFVQQLALNNRLTPSMIMRAMCLGHVSFVEHALSELSGLPHHRTWLLLHDAGSLGLRKIFEHAGLPKGMHVPFQMAINVYHELDYDGLDGDRERFRKRMVERVLTQFQNIPKADLDYLLEKLDAYREVEDQRSDEAA